MSQLAKEFFGTSEINWVTFDDGGVVRIVAANMPQRIGMARYLRQAKWIPKETVGKIMDTKTNRRAMNRLIGRGFCFANASTGCPIVMF